MQQTIILKTKLLTGGEVLEFDFLTKMYMNACNFISNWIFNHNMQLNKYKIQKQIYHQIRNTFYLKSQLAISAIKTVVVDYKTLQTTISRRPYKYIIQNPHNKTIYKYQKRNLNWLQKPIRYHKPIANLQRNRDWSIVGNKISIITLSVRLRFKYISPKHLKGTWKLGMGRLIKKQNTWYLYICATKTLPNYNIKQTKHIVGIDRGLRFLATCYDEKGKTTFYSGKKIIYKRMKYKKLRQQLQERNTKSSRRRLRKIGHRENGWINNINHCLSKALVEQYGPNTLFVLEDLTNAMSSFAKQKRGRYICNTWAFKNLENDLTYKARLNHSLVIKVSPKYTSQHCPKCGRINKKNRNHKLHLYKCDKCGYSTNDDRIAAINIQHLGKLFVSGVKHPKFKKQ